MPLEIERKYLVHPERWDALKKPLGKRITQSYLSFTPERTVRVRIKDTSAFITIKGKSQGISRLEYEYPIPVLDAEQMIEKLQLDAIDKIRYEIPVDDHIWEVDVFLGNNKGLILAEIELKSEDEAFTIPDWISEEVSLDTRYYNSNLLQNPINTWKPS